MVGNAFPGLELAHLTPTVYNDVKKDVTAKLESLDILTRVVVPAEWPGETTYRQINFFVSPRSPPELSAPQDDSNWGYLIGKIKSVLNTSHGHRGPNNPDCIYFALPLGEIEDNKWIPIKIKICFEAELFEWQAFQLQYGNISAIMGSMVKPLGLKINPKGLHVLAQHFGVKVELEASNNEGAASADDPDKQSTSNNGGTSNIESASVDEHDGQKNPSTVEGAPDSAKSSELTKSEKKKEKKRKRRQKKMEEGNKKMEEENKKMKEDNKKMEEEQKTEEEKEKEKEEEKKRKKEVKKQKKKDIRDRYSVFITRDPKAVLEIFGLDRSIMDEGISSQEELYNYLASSWLFNPAHFASRLAQNRYNATLTKQSYQWIDFITYWVPQRLPTRPLSSRATAQRELDSWYETTRMTLRDTIFSFFPDAATRFYSLHQAPTTEDEEQDLKAAMANAIPRGNAGFDELWPFTLNADHTDPEKSEISLKAPTGVTQQGAWEVPLYMKRAAGLHLPTTVHPPAKSMTKNVRLRCLARWTSISGDGKLYLRQHPRDKKTPFYWTDATTAGLSKALLLQWARDMWWHAWIRQGLTNFVGAHWGKIEKKAKKAKEATEAKEVQKEEDEEMQAEMQIEMRKAVEEAMEKETKKPKERNV